MKNKEISVVIDMAKRKNISLNIKKKQKKKLSDPKYSNDDLKKAIKSVGNGKSLFQASKENGIPWTTLKRKFSNKEDAIKARGRPPNLSVEDENDLEKHIIQCCKRAHNPTLQDVLDSVKKSLDSVGKFNVFPNNRPGYTWFRGFLHRHPRLKLKKYKYISPAACNVSEASIRRWTAKTKRDVYSEYGQEGLNALADPDRNYNDDESSMSHNPEDSTKYLTFDHQPAKVKMFGKEKVNTSINLTTCANGTFTRTLLLLPYEKSIPEAIRDSIDLEFFDFIGGTGYECHDSYEYYLEHVSNILACHKSEFSL